MRNHIKLIEYGDIDYEKLQKEKKRKEKKETIEARKQKSK